MFSVHEIHHTRGQGLNPEAVTLTSNETLPVKEMEVKLFVSIVGVKVITPGVVRRKSHQIIREVPILKNKILIMIKEVVRILLKVKMIRIILN